MALPLLVMSKGCIIVSLIVIGDRWGASARRQVLRPQPQPLGVTAAAGAVSRRGGRRHPVEWAYVNVDVGGGGAFAYGSRVR